MPTVTLIHEHAHLLSNLGEVHTAVHTGRWSIAADLCADKALDLPGQRAALDQIAAASGVTFADSDTMPEITAALTGGDTLAIDGPDIAQIRSALDLYTRLLCGQWLELAWTFGAPTRTRGGGHDADDLLLARQQFGRVATGPMNLRRHPLADNEWPHHPATYISIASAVLPARVAYHLYKDLDSATAVPPTFLLPGGPIRVHVGPGQPVTHPPLRRGW
jgi:hypothetical protein